MSVTFGKNNVKLYKPSDLVESCVEGCCTNSVKGILKDTSAKSRGDCYVPLCPFARSLRQNFYFQDQFAIEFDDDGRGRRSNFLQSMDLHMVDPSPTSSEDTQELLLEELSWKSLNEAPGNRRDQTDAMLDFVTGFEDETDYRYDAEGELWAFDEDFC